MLGPKTSKIACRVGTPDCLVVYITTRVGKPWSPRTILKEAQKVDPKAFARLTEQVIS
jgi:hypothetical protein